MKELDLNKKSGIDKRSYSRVPCYLNSVFRKLSHPKEAQICPTNIIESNKNKAVTAAYLVENSTLPAELVSILLNIDYKLDAILGHLTKSNLADHFPLKMIVHEISGAGLLVQSNDLKNGDYVELVMSLSEFPVKTASAIGRVLKPGKPIRADMWAVELTTLRENDREEIIRFVFQEDRQRIRSVKYK